FDAGFQVTLSASELAYYQSIGYGPAEIQTLVNTRTAEYHVLHTQYGGFDDPIGNTATKSIFLGQNPGVQSGDALDYDAEGNTAIGGLTDGDTYFAFAIGDGSVRLYDTEAHALAGGNTGVVTLTSGATGTHQRFTFTESVHFNPTGKGVVNTGNET